MNADGIRCGECGECERDGRQREISLAGQTICVTLETIREQTKSETNS